MTIFSANKASAWKFCKYRNVHASATVQELKKKKVFKVNNHNMTIFPASDVSILNPS